MFRISGSGCVGCSGLRVSGSGFRASDFDFRVWGVGFRVFRVSGVLGLGCFGCRVFPLTEFGVRDSGFGIWDSVPGIRCSGFGMRVPGFGIRGSGSAHRTWRGSESPARHSLGSCPPAQLSVYRGTSLLIKRTPLGPYRRPMPRVLGGF